MSKIWDELEEKYRHVEVLKVAEVAELQDTDRRTVYKQIENEALSAVINLGPGTIRIAVRPFFVNDLRYGVRWHQGSPYRQKQMLTTKEAAEVLQVGVKKVRQRINNGELPGGVIISDGCFRIVSKQFFNWLDGQKSLSLNSDD